ncbi:MAG: exonuclease domain-containing protein [Candidatus Saccharibacteria bacterium]|nr:exonuclease domain-containing protein [Candidatus Saccharibacteria bacterium]
MLDLPICITDIETTGGSSRRDGITEIAIIKVHGGKIIDEYTSLVNPGQSIPEFITAITGISNATVADAPYFAEIAADVSRFYEGCYFMAHNVLFDFSFIKRQLELLGYSFKPRILCSVKLSRALHPGVKGHSLQKIIERHNIQTSNRHRAYDDALAVHDFMRLMASERGEESVIAALQRQLKLKSLPANFDESYLEGIANTPGVYIFKDQSGTPVYIGKSVALRNRILSHFNQSTKLDKEMRISQSTHSLDVIRTDSEIEALLLESKLIKEKLPVYNRMLRKKNTRVVLTRTKDPSGYHTVAVVERNLQELDDVLDVYGIFDTHAAVKKHLLAIRDEMKLCSKLLNLEKSTKACFSYQLGKCSGACIGKESPELYNLRFEQAFQKTKVQDWKYTTPVILKISESKGLLIDRWVIKGKIDFTDQDLTIDRYESSFDLDEYNILKKYLTSSASIIPYDILSPGMKAAVS